MTVKTESVVLCDDARQEITGKYILIGVYGGTIITNRLPLNFRPSWFVQLNADKGAHKFDFRIVGPNDASLLDGQFEFGVAESGSAGIVLPRTQLQIQSAGPLRLQWKTSGQGEWETIKELNVILRTTPQRTPTTNPSSNASEPPVEKSQPAAPKS